MNKQSGWSIFVDNPFIEGLFESMVSAEGQLSEDVMDLIWQSLRNVDVDATDRKLIWEDGKRLSIEASVQRIHREYAEFPLDLIEDQLFGWLEMEFAAESYCQEQLDELDRLTKAWINDHYAHQKSW